MCVETIELPEYTLVTLERFLKYCDLTAEHVIGERGILVTSEQHLIECLTADRPIGHDQHKKNISFDPMDRFDLIQCLSMMFEKHSIQQSGNFLYPPGGYMSWHTNSNTPGERVYLTYVPESDKSFFRYRNNQGDIITSYDKTGWTMRRFHAGKHDNLLWHCVYSDTYRLSVGFRLMKNLKS